jgi:hypothetical protein
VRRYHGHRLSEVVFSRFHAGILGILESALAQNLGGGSARIIFDLDE